MVIRHAIVGARSSKPFLLPLFPVLRFQSSCRCCFWFFTRISLLNSDIIQFVQLLGVLRARAVSKRLWHGSRTCGNHLVLRGEQSRCRLLALPLNYLLRHHLHVILPAVLTCRRQLKVSAEHVLGFLAAASSAHDNSNHFLRARILLFIVPRLNRQVIT